MIQHRRYCLISPCRDEAQYMRRTLDSVLSQTIPPTLWIVVDDGSTDDTPRILDEYARKHANLRVIRREDRGKRSVGPGVIEAFYAGYDVIEPEVFDYICKIDLDLALPAMYFERLIEKMEADPQLGTCSGKPYFPGPENDKGCFEGELISEACGDDMSVGMTKFYRTACFEQIGGFVRQVMWDGIDCHRCRMHGWRACSLDHPDLRFIHLRPMGSSQEGILTGRMRHGFGQWFMGTGPFYMAASVVFRLSRPPLVVGGLAMAWGYLWSMLQGQPRYDDHEFRTFLRRYHRLCLLRGKARAAELVRAQRHHAQTPHSLRRTVQTIA